MQLFFIRHAQSENNALFAAGRGAEVRGHDPALTDLGVRQAECLAEALASAKPGLVTDTADSQNRASFGLTHIYCSLMVRAVATGTVVAGRLGLPLHAWLDWHEEGGLYLDGENDERLPSAGPGRADFARNYPGLVLPGDLTDAGWWARPISAAAERPGSAAAERPDSPAAVQPDSEPVKRLDSESVKRPTSAAAERPYSESVKRPDSAAAERLDTEPVMRPENDSTVRPFEEPSERPVRARRVLAELAARHPDPNDRVAVISHGGFYNHLIGALLDLQPPYPMSYLMNNTGISRMALTAQGNYLVYQNRCAHLPDGMVTF